MRYLISGGAALPNDTYDLFAGLGLRLTEGYGLTEASPVLTVAGTKGAPRAGHVGKPIPGVQVRIDAPDASGVGEVVARGPNVMLGYTDPEATKQVIDEDGWLHTGDLGKFDKKGRLSIVGRLKDVIVTTTGENVYPDDVENRLGKIRTSPSTRSSASRARRPRAHRVPRRARGRRRDPARSAWIVRWPSFAPRSASSRTGSGRRWCTCSTRPCRARRRAR
ncbi:MAG: AMP-binding protein [Polyangiaceae bacterium]